MKHKSVKWREYKWGILMTVLILICLFPCMLLLTAYTKPLSDEIVNLTIEENDMKGWEAYVIEDGKRIPLTHLGYGSFSGLSYPGQTFYVSRVMNEAFEDAVLELHGSVLMGVFIDDELLYTEEINAGTELNNLAFSGTYDAHLQPALITLPFDYAGKTLTIAQAQVCSEKQVDDGSVFFSNVTLYSANALYSSYSSASVETAYLSAVLAILGIILAVLFIVNVFRRKTDFSILFLSLFSLTWMVDELLRSSLACHYYSLTLTQLEQYLYFICFIFLTLFLLVKMERCRKWYLPFVIAQGLAVILSAVTQNHMEYSDLSVFLGDLPQLITFFSIAAGIVFAAIEAHHMSWRYRMFIRLFLAAIGMLAVICLISVLGDGAFFDEFNQNMWDFKHLIFRYQLYILRFMLIGVCFVLAVAEFIHLVALQNAERRLIEKKNLMTKKSYDQLYRYTHQTMTLRHDMKKHLSIVDYYLQDGKIEKAHMYLQEVNMSMDKAARVSNTGNELIDMILSSKLAEAESKGIATKISCAPLPLELPFPDTDLSSLFMNSLDNAIAAASALPSGILEADIQIRKSFLCYSVKNTAKQTTIPHTEYKNPNDAHGYGLSIMEQIVEKNQGIINTEFNKNIFTLHIALPLLPSNKSEES